MLQYIKHITPVFAVFLCLAAAGCSARGEKAALPDSDSAPTLYAAFNADSAYSYVAAQTAMGPRTPGSAAHAQCRRWMTAQLRSAGADSVWQQSGTMPSPTGKGTVQVNNIIGRFNTSAPQRVLLLAHYDTRPWADADPNPANHTRPIDGANDGASGVAVLLELARQFKIKNPAVGVDILMTDVEDSGSSDEGADNTWCLGSQYFANNLPYPAGRLPYAAVLLDMVGARGAVFGKEYFSLQAAPQYVNQIWDTASALGLGSRFPANVAGAVNDDHIPLIRAGIPTVDIIEIGHPATGSFNPSWHTMADNLDGIDTQTLHAVGTAVSGWIYSQKP